jgi:hypothetical protein
MQKTGSVRSGMSCFTYNGCKDIARGQPGKEAPTWQRCSVENSSRITRFSSNPNPKCLEGESMPLSLPGQKVCKHRYSGSYRSAFVSPEICMCFILQDRADVLMQYTVTPSIAVLATSVTVSCGVWRDSSTHLPTACLPGVRSEFFEGARNRRIQQNLTSSSSGAPQPHCFSSDRPTPAFVVYSSAPVPEVRSSLFPPYAP